MPAMLHNPSVREALRARVASLNPASTRQWGKMSVDQMLWHVNQTMAYSLGDMTAAPMKTPLPAPIMKLLVLNMPWPKGAPTVPELIAGERYSFDTERARCLELIDRFTARKLDDASWGISPSLGALTGKEWSRLNAKHLNHHLTQFSA